MLLRTELILIKKLSEVSGTTRHENLSGATTHKHIMLMNM